MKNISYCKLVRSTILISKKAQSHSCDNLIFMIQHVKCPKGKHIGHHYVCPKPMKIYNSSVEHLSAEVRRQTLKNIYIRTENL
jgi:hypothetical protein